MSGIKQEAIGKYNADMTDPGRGRHLWTVIAVYRINNPAISMDPKGQMHLDTENLITIEGPGCFKCEKNWTADIGRRFCQGSMTKAMP